MVFLVVKISQYSSSLKLAAQEMLICNITVQLNMIIMLIECTTVTVTVVEIHVLLLSVLLTYL
jgi:hypothetical protein